MQTLFGRYICECCTNAIQCSPEVAGAISTNLWPAYEDLFDEAEEHALDILLGQWNDLCNSEDVTFQKVRIEALIPPVLQCLQLFQLK